MFGGQIQGVRVRTGARLHFGLLAVGDIPGRKYGGLGMMIDQPGYDLVCRRRADDSVDPVPDQAARNSQSSTAPATADEIVAPPALHERLRHILQTYRANTPTEFCPPPVSLTITQEIPQHVGLGAGTQLALAVAQSLAVLLHDPVQHDVRLLAQRVGRGQRSAIGLHGFQQGGLLIEGGKCHPDDISPLLVRTPFPESWRLLLIRPTHDHGLSGCAEVEGFRRLAPMPRELTAALCRLILLDFLPALVETDFATASAALYDFGHLVGQYFLPVQGGVFAHAGIAQLAEKLRAEGITGLAQSSWGPTLCVLCESATAAEGLQNFVHHHTPAAPFLAQITHARNTGAHFDILSNL